MIVAFIPKNLKIILSSSHIIQKPNFSAKVCSIKKASAYFNPRGKLQRLPRERIARLFGKSGIDFDKIHTLLKFMRKD